MQTNEVITKRIAVAGLVCFLVYAAVILSPTRAPAPQSPPSAPVTVVNTTANPVPVIQQGPVTLNGTPNVNIANTPNVNVANTAASPVLVRSVDSGSAEPVEASVAFPSGRGTSVIAGSLYTVPAGKRLVVEHVSAVCSVRTGTRLEYASIGTLPAGNGGPALYLIPVLTGPSSLGGDSFVISQAVKFYVSAGEQLYVAAYETTVTDGVGTFSFTGYLVNAP